MNNKYKDPHWDYSIFTKDQSSIDVEHLFVETMEEWKRAKHRKTSKFEINYLNSKAPECCPYCNSKKIIKYGYRNNGLRNYKCNSCLRKFNILTGTIFDNHKIPISEWIEYLIHLFEFHSIKSSSRDNRNSDTTGHYWLLKIFEILMNYQDNIHLSGRVYLDETYFKVVKSKRDGKLKSHLICVLVACDKNNVLIINENIRKENELKTLELLKNRIETKSTLVHDGNFSHNLLIEKLNLYSEVHPVKETRKLEGKNNPLYPVNNIHSLMKKFIERKDAFSRERLQDWCNLFSFIVNPPKNRYKKILIFIEKAIKHKKIMRFRDEFNQKIR